MKFHAIEFNLIKIYLQLCFYQRTFLDKVQLLIRFHDLYFL